LFSVCDGLRCCALAFVLFALPGRAAAALSDDAKPRANALLAEARQLYDRGEYGSALDRLNQAYAAFPSPVIHFNFGQVYRALLRDVEALESFDRFITEGTDQDPTLRHEAEIYLVELTHRVGTIEITADVVGASVNVDGKTAGTTPLGRGLHVMPGGHQIVVQGGDGAIPFVRKVEVTAGQTTRVEAKVTVPAMSVASASALPEPRPVYRRWWFWTGVVVAAVVTTLVIAYPREECPYARCTTFP
jgi:hypothetical protein